VLRSAQVLLVDMQYGAGDDPDADPHLAEYFLEEISASHRHSRGCFLLVRNVRRCLGTSIGATFTLHCCVELRIVRGSACLNIVKYFNGDALRSPTIIPSYHALDMRLCFILRVLSPFSTHRLPHRSFLTSLYTHISSILEMRRSDSFLHLLFFSAVDGNKLYRRVGTNGIEGSYLPNASRALRLS